MLGTQVWTSILDVTFGHHSWTSYFKEETKFGGTICRQNGTRKTKNTHKKHMLTLFTEEVSDQK